jgi:hypothetical protein
MGLKPGTFGLKPKNHAVHDNFEVTQNSDGTYDIKCKHCSLYSKTLRTLNAIKLRNHSVTGSPKIRSERLRLPLRLTKGSTNMQR